MKSDAAALAATLAAILPCDAGASAFAFAFASRSGPSSSATALKSSTNEADFLNNFLGSAGPEDWTVQSDLNKPQPQEPIQPWGVNLREPAEPPRPEVPVDSLLKTSSTTTTTTTETETTPTAAASTEVMVEKAAEAQVTKEETVDAEKGGEPGTTMADIEAGGKALSSQSRYLDSHGSAYVNSLADGRKPVNGEGTVNGSSASDAAQADSDSAAAATTAVATATAAATDAADDPAGTVVLLTSLLASRDSELAALREEHRAVKAAAADLLTKYHDIAEGLEGVETALMKCADAFPDPDEGGFESYEWLLNR